MFNNTAKQYVNSGDLHRAISTAISDFLANELTIRASVEVMSPADDSRLYVVIRHPSGAPLSDENLRIANIFARGFLVGAKTVTTVINDADEWDDHSDKAVNGKLLN